MSPAAIQIAKIGIGTSATTLHPQSPIGATSANAELRKIMYMPHRRTMSRYLASRRIGMPLQPPMLVSIPYSPWSRRAVLAVSRMQVAVRRMNYTATLSEPWLRWRLRRPFGRVTVPVLLGDGFCLTDSLDIVHWASDRTEGIALAPPELRPEIARWNDRAERALRAGRLLTTTLVRANDAALRASLPAPVARLGPIAMPIAQSATGRSLKKYGDGRGPGAWTEELARYCDELAEETHDEDHLLGEPSYADITAAMGLAFVMPDPDAPVAEAAWPCWTRPELVERHPELFAWRDRVLAR